jgi:hypothetical protein
MYFAPVQTSIAVTDRGLTQQSAFRLRCPYRFINPSRQIFVLVLTPARAHRHPWVAAAARFQRMRRLICH